MSAKLLSLVVVVLLLHVAINTLPGLWLPVASPFGYFRAALALQVALLMQTVFACSAIVALQGAVSLALPDGRRAARLVGPAGGDPARGGPPLRGRGGSISRLAYAMRDASHPVNWVVPVVWFRAVYVQLLGVDSAPLAAQARLACVATAAAVAAAVPCSLLGYRDAGRVGKAAGTAAGSPLPDRPPSSSGARRRPVARAVSSFVGAALLRSPSAGLIARGLFVVGLALTLSGLGGLALRDLGYSAPVIPAEPLHAPAFVLPFFALVGLRLSAVYPASTEANWIFRLTEAVGSTDYAAGVRWAALRTVVLPLLVLLAGPVRGALGPGDGGGSPRAGARGRPRDRRVAVPGLSEDPVHVHVPAGEGQPARDVAEVRRHLLRVLRPRAPPRRLAPAATRGLSREPGVAADRLALARARRGRGRRGAAAWSSTRRPTLT